MKHDFEKNYSGLTLKLMRGRKVDSLPKLLEQIISYALRLVSGQFGDVLGLQHMKSFGAQMVTRVSSEKDGVNDPGKTRNARA